MAVRVCVLGSGSSGNCSFIGTEGGGLLVDAGLSCREIVRRLEAIGEEMSRVTAVCVTHEHDDHVGALSTIQRRYGAMLYANAGTVEAIERAGKFKGLRWNMFTTGYPFTVGGLIAEPFSVPHDSYDPVGFVFSSGNARIGVVTDMGMATNLIREKLRTCDVVVVESNHDEGLLREAERPWSLKQRIAGRQGHLSNSQAAEMIGEIAGDRLKTVFLAHLSRDCNRCEMAVDAMRRALDSKGLASIEVKLTYPDRNSDVAAC